MFDKLFATAFLAASMGLNLNASTPNRAPTPVEKTLMNSTSYDIHFYHELNVHAHSYEVIGTEPADFWQNTYVTIFADDKPTDVFYWVNQIDNETEVNLYFSEVGNDEFVAYLPDLSSDTISGIQFFQKVSMVGDTYYLVQPNLSNTDVVNSNLLPENSTANLHLSNGNTASITNLRYEKTAMDRGIIAFAQFKINNMTYIANNSLTGITPVDSSQVTNIMMYKENYTNRITFTSGTYARQWNTQGYSKLSGLLSEEYQPYVTYTSANNMGISLVPLTTGVTLVGLSFDALNSLFGYIVFPGITLGMLLLIPVILGIVFTIVKLVKKGS